MPRQQFLGSSISELEEQLDRDPTRSVPGAPPNFGEYAIPHMLSFNSIVTSIAQVYRPSDEALRHSWQSALAMRNDCGLMESLEARQRATALLDWQLVPEDDKSQEQKDLCTELERILRRVSRFTEYRLNLLHALWYGRYAVQHRWRWRNVNGQQRVYPAKEGDSLGWKPINGDKLVFRYNAGGVMSETRQSDQVGVRVSARFRENEYIAQRWRIENVANAMEPTDQGMAYFLAPWERPLLAIHRHTIEDGDYFASESAGSIHGVGIRSRIYWDWFQKQEALAFLMEYLERSAGGIEVWHYPSGNPEAKKAVEDAATKRVSHGRNIIFNPKPPGDDAALFGVDIIEPGMAGIESLKDLLVNYFGHRIKRYICGQVLTSEAEATGLGSGVADLHLDTFLQIVKYDSSNLQETITDDLVRPMQLWNFPQSAATHVRFEIITEDEDVDRKLKGYQSAWDMGAGIPEKAVLDMIGVPKATADDVILRNPSMSGGMMGGGGLMNGGPQLHAQAANDLQQRIRAAVFANPMGNGKSNGRFSHAGGAMGAV